MSDINAGKSLELAGSLRKPLGWLIALAGAPLLIALIGVAAVYPKLASNPTLSHLPLVAFLAPLIILVAFVLLAWNLMRAGVQVEDGALIVNTGLGSKRFALSSLRAAGLRVVDLNEHTELKPIWRTWGTGLPGFAGGWFRLRNGEKAVCLLLDRRRVSYLRSDADNLSLLLSLAEPETLRALLER